MKGGSDQPAPGMGPDDPRISEWIDGRLDPAAADEVQRAVRGSPALSLLVEELRSLKSALAAHETAAVPAGFVRDVMAAVTAAGGGTAADPVVEAEWRRLEEGRIAEERAEACKDAVEPPRLPPPRWGWLAIAGALAAGLLVAALVNVPRDGDREVAMTAGDPLPPPPAGPLTDDEADLQAEDSGAAAAAPPAEQLAERSLARRAAQPAAADAVGSGAAPDRDAQGDAETQAAPVQALAESAPQRDVVAAGESRTENRREATRGAAGSAALGRGAASAPLQAKTAEAAGVRVVIVRVDGARGREALGRLIGAGDLRIADGEQAAAARAREGAREASDAASPAERITVAGPPQAVADLLSSLAGGTRESGFVLSANGLKARAAPMAARGVNGAAGFAGATADTTGGSGFPAAGQPLEHIAIIVVNDPTMADAAAAEAAP